jgi:PhnB protein
LGSHFSNTSPSVWDTIGGMSTNDGAREQSNFKPVPQGYHTASPYLIAANAAAALEFYRTAFGATAKRRLAMPDGKIMHAEMKIGDSILMLADEFPSHDAFGPEHFGGSPASVVLYVENADALYAQAIEAGATSLRAMADQPFGDRSGTIRDPFGHRWTLITHIEDVSEEEIARRFAEMMAGDKNPRVTNRKDT